MVEYWIKIITHPLIVHLMKIPPFGRDLGWMSICR